MLYYNQLKSLNKNTLYVTIQNLAIKTKSKNKDFGEIFGRCKY